MNPTDTSSSLNSTSTSTTNTKPNGSSEIPSEQTKTTNVPSTDPSLTTTTLPNAPFPPSSFPPFSYSAYPTYPPTTLYNQQQADYYAKYALYQQQQQQQQMLQAYQQYYAAAMQQQFQRQPQPNTMRNNFHDPSSSASTNPSLINATSTFQQPSLEVSARPKTKKSTTAISPSSLASSPWNLATKTNVSTSFTASTPSVDISKSTLSPPQPSEILPKQPIDKPKKPAPWASMGMKKVGPSKVTTTKVTEEKKQSQPVSSIDMSNPKLRTFIKGVLRESTTGSNELRQSIRTRLMEYLKSKDASHDWSKDDPHSFVVSSKASYEETQVVTTALGTTHTTSPVSPTPPSPSPPPVVSASVPSPVSPRPRSRLLGTRLGKSMPVDAFSTFDEEESKKKAREARFREQHETYHAHQRDSQVAPHHLSKYIDVHREVVADFDAQNIVVGTCQRLEKPYLRLTSAPNPANVRPLPVLHQAFDHLKGKWINDRNYTFMCDQLKSLRQDLMVQRIQTDFTVEVYETHARIALEMSDFSEFNQCQTQIKLLYQKGLSGCRYEFLGYRILYAIFTKSRRDMKVLLKSLNAQDFNNPFVKYALCVREACLRGNFVQFLELFQNPLNMGGYLLIQLLDRERCKALHVLTKSHVQLTLSFLMEYLGFTSLVETGHFINEVLQKACEVAVPQPDLTPLLINTLQSSKDDVIACSKIRRLIEVYLIAYKKVDIKGQVH